MPLGAFRQSLHLSNLNLDFSAIYGSYQGYFACNTATTLAAYNTAGTVLHSVTHGVGTSSQQIRSKRIPGTTSQIVIITGDSAGKIYRYTPGTGFVQLVNLAVTTRGCDIAFDTVNSRIYMVMTRSGTPFIQIYDAPMNATITSVGTLASPATLPTGTPAQVRFSNNSNALAVNHNISPFLTVYTRSGTTFTSITVPNTGTAAPITTSRHHHLSWNANTTALIDRASATTIRLWSFNGTALTNQGTTSFDGASLSFNPNPQFANLILANNANNEVRAFYNLGTSITTTAAATGIITRQPYWSPDGTRVALSTSISAVDLYSVSSPYNTTSVFSDFFTFNQTISIGNVGFDWMYY
jgi:hypothetical protein